MELNYTNTGWWLKALISWVSKYLFINTIWNGQLELDINVFAVDSNMWKHRLVVHRLFQQGLIDQSRSNSTSLKCIISLLVFDKRGERTLTSGALMTMWFGCRAPEAAAGIVWEAWIRAVCLRCVHVASLCSEVGWRWVTAQLILPGEVHGTWGQGGSLVRLQTPSTCPKTGKKKWICIIDVYGFIFLHQRDHIGACSISWSLFLFY